MCLLLSLGVFCVAGEVWLTHEDLSLPGRIGSKTATFVRKDTFHKVSLKDI